jgi:hypothetical protein
MFKLLQVVCTAFLTSLHWFLHSSVYARTSSQVSSILVPVALANVSVVKRAFNLFNCHALVSYISMLKYIHTATIYAITGTY